MILSSGSFESDFFCCFMLFYDAGDLYIAR